MTKRIRYEVPARASCLAGMTGDWVFIPVRRSRGAEGKSGICESPCSSRCAAQRRARVVIHTGFCRAPRKDSAPPGAFLWLLSYCYKKVTRCAGAEPHNRPSRQ